MIGNPMKKTAIAQTAAIFLLACSTSGFAQTNTDLQGARPVAPPSADRVELPRFSQGGALPAAGGATVQLKQVEITGNQSISTATLLARLGDVQGRSLDMRGLAELVNAISAYYRESGYVFSQAYMPPQDLGAGVLKINVIEGQYGAITAVGKDNLDKNVQPFLDYGLFSGAPIENKQLERTLLIVDDLPGIKIQPVIKPGTAQGTADLLVNVVQDEKEETGSIGFDNTGPRSTGEYRLRGTAHFNNKLMFGDKITLSGLVTDKRMWLGSIDYDAPVGYSGLRGSVGYSRSSYVLGGAFASLGAHGIAETVTGQLTHPVVRSQATNLYMSLGLQHKDLKDIYDSVNTTRKKHTNAVLLGARFDNRDRIGGGGITYGSMTLMHGSLGLDSSSLSTDAATAQSAGSFSKFNLDVARIQSLVGDFSLYGRFSGQWANKNLDSSEKFNLGGFYGVRSHPLGEGTGDKGYLGQLELRYALSPAFTPFAFYDAGHSKVNVNPWDANSSGTRTLTGHGVGLRSLYEGWSIDMTLAYQDRGGATTSDTINRNPRFFIMAGTRF